MIWREKRLMLTVLGVLLAANVIFFFTYRVRYQERLNDLDTRLEASQTRLQRAQAVRQQAEKQMQLYRNEQRDIVEIYNDRWSTQAARLAPLIVEVKRLAAISHLIPPSYNFTDTASKTDQTGALPTSVVGISFGVQGTYDQIRQLINLLELSPQFVIIDTISLGGTSEKVLTLTIHVKTLFRDTNPSRATPSQSS